MVSVKYSSYVAFDAALITKEPTQDRLLGCSTCTTPPLQNAEHEACDACSSTDLRLMLSLGVKHSLCSINGIVNRALIGSLDSKFESDLTPAATT